MTIESLCESPAIQLRCDYIQSAVVLQLWTASSNSNRKVIIGLHAISSYWQNAISLWTVSFTHKSTCEPIAVGWLYLSTNFVGQFPFGQFAPVGQLPLHQLVGLLDSNLLDYPRCTNIKWDYRANIAQNHMGPSCRRKSHEIMYTNIYRANCMRR